MPTLPISLDEPKDCSSTALSNRVDTSSRHGVVGSKTCDYASATRAPAFFCAVIDTILHESAAPVMLPHDARLGSAEASTNYFEVHACFCARRRVTLRALARDWAARLRGVRAAGACCAKERLAGCRLTLAMDARGSLRLPPFLLC